MKKILLASVLALTSASSFAANMGFDNVGVKAGMLTSSGHDPKEISLSVSKELVGGMYGVANYTNSDFDGLNEIEGGDSFTVGLGYHIRVAQPVDLYVNSGIQNTKIDFTVAEGDTESGIDETMGYARVGAKLIASEKLMFDVSYGMNFGGDDARAERSDVAASVNYFVSNEFSFGLEYAMVMHDKDMEFFGNGSDSSASRISFLASYNF